jgi:hypothetical protein
MSDKLKYALYSDSCGWYLGFFNGKHSFSCSEEQPELLHDFVSETGARAHLEIMPALAKTPADLVVTPIVPITK